MQKHRLNYFTLALILLVSSLGCNRTQQANTNSKPVINAQPVVLRIENNSDAPAAEFTIPWQEKQTVLDAMNAAKTQGLKFNITGDGDLIMVSDINDVTSVGTGKDAKFWLYYVNEKKANRSVSAYSINPGDVILWKLQAYE
jgi:hypothetical protein